ncbi:uncharacterized protein LOC112589631 [Harpegnathos saltator]|uniref:uncharacterized protein LOC112589631 n=1 Tax=Harpegnathos saltator TaxID=610380 RepID=UPI000DBED6AE|nr:uncharacterized protein LOC112589631 [Harpegnathos saltator]
MTPIEGISAPPTPNLLPKKQKFSRKREISLSRCEISRIDIEQISAVIRAALLTVIFQVTPMCVYFTEIYLHCNGAKESFDKVTPGAAAALALTRLITPRIHRRELLEIVTSMMNDWATQRDQRVRWIMKKYATLSRRVTTFTFFLVGVIVGVYIFMAISAVTAQASQLDHQLENVNVSRETDEVLSCVFRGESMSQAFMVVQAMQMFVTGILTFGTTSFFFGLAMHLCGQFDALAIKLSDFRVEQAHHAIAEAVERHCHLIRMTDRMEESFNANVLIYLFVTTTLMCIDGK